MLGRFYYKRIFGDTLKFIKIFNSNSFKNFLSLRKKLQELTLFGEDFF